MLQAAGTHHIASLPWAQHRPPSHTPHSDHWEWVREDTEDRCSLPELNCSIRYHWAHWPSNACLSGALRQWNCCHKTAISMSIRARKRRRQATSLPQYTNDLPVAHSRRFIYADDICCALQAKTFSKTECTLVAHLAQCPSCQILSAVASETQHVQDCDKCFPPA